MKVLLVHPKDDPPSDARWDLIVDFGRAPAATYERWSRETGSVVTSIYDFAEGARDLRLCRKLLASGMGVLVDEHGIDWWDVLSLRLVSDLQQLILLERLLKSIDSPVQLHATRPLRLARVFQQRLNSPMLCEPLGFRRCGRDLWRKFRRLDRVQVAQILQDKFDRHHTIRSVFTMKRSGLHGPAVLLPTAYVNVSRMAVRYAELLPEQKFLLACARRSGELQSFPANVATVSLGPYFAFRPIRDTRLMHDWGLLRKRLVETEPIFEAAEDCGILEGVGSDLQWLLRIRDAWINVLDREHVTGCFSADDTNPYTRIALLVTKARGLPTVACHHGALDYWMAFKNPVADCYLAKTELENDYLIHRCGIPPEKVILGGPNGSSVRLGADRNKKGFIVWFTEAYEASGWRREEVYRDLLPRLYALAQSCGLKLVLKLHPFDSVSDHRRKLRNILKSDAGCVEIIDGPTNAELWGDIRFALTAESSIALECAARRIPIFLCTWLRDCYSGYSEQYAKFGVGISLQSSEQIADIPSLLASHQASRAPAEQSIAPEVLQGLFSGAMIRESPFNEQTFATCGT